MSHDALRERLLDLAYGELSPREARKVEAHLASCEACRGELARLKETRRLMSALGDEPAPERGERVLLAAAREAAARRPRRRLLPRWLWGATVAAASAAVVAVVSYRLIELRPGPLGGGDAQPMMGRGSYATPPPAEAARPAPAQPGPASAAAPQPEAAAPAPASPRATDGAAPEPRLLQRAERAPAPAPKPAPRAAAAKRAEEAPEPRAGAAARDEVPAAEAERLRPLEELHAPYAAPPPAAGAAPASPATSPEASAEPRGRAAAAPAPAPAPAPRSAAPAAPSRAAKRASAPPDAALRRLAVLRAEGALRVEVRRFGGCEGEAVRTVESDRDGQTVVYVREGRVGGRRLRIEHVYGEDGALAAATARDLDAPSEPVDADRLGLALPSRAEDARIDAPPRCGR